MDLCFRQRFYKFLFVLLWRLLIYGTIIVVTFLVVDLFLSSCCCCCCCCCNKKQSIVFEISRISHESTFEQSFNLGSMSLGHGASRLDLCNRPVVGYNLFSGRRHASCLGCPTCQAKDYRTNNASSTAAATEKGNQGSHGCVSDT